MDNVLATIVVAGLAGSPFGKISAISIGTATLLYKDFYQTILKKSTDDTTSSALPRLSWTAPDPARDLRARRPEGHLSRQVAVRDTRACRGAAMPSCRNEN
jgi:hypothetical protein